MYTASFRVYEKHSEGNCIIVEDPPHSEGDLVTIRIDGQENEQYFGKADITMSIDTAIDLTIVLNKLIAIMKENKVK
jgi:hypothetical protein